METTIDRAIKGYSGNINPVHPDSDKGKAELAGSNEEPNRGFKIT